jgi:hypothetical protein
MLIEAGELSLDAAFDRLVPTILEIADCRCDHEMMKKFEDLGRDRRDHQHGDAADHGGAVASTVQALEYELRTYGIDQLKKSRTQGRIAELSGEQMTDLVAALQRMQPEYLQITDELVQILRLVPK